MRTAKSGLRLADLSGSFIANNHGLAFNPIHSFMMRGIMSDLLKGTSIYSSLGAAFYN